MPANTDPREAESYYYRRPVTGRELLPAVVIGIGAGLLAFYVVRIFAQRRRLLDDSSPRKESRIRTRSAGVAG